MLPSGNWCKTPIFKRDAIPIHEKRKKGKENRLIWEIATKEFVGFHKVERPWMGDFLLWESAENAVCELRWAPLIQGGLLL